ncbi:enoyl-CoA hydratase/isomerase family protein, partial [Staphylococcus aureus]
MNKNDGIVWGVEDGVGHIVLDRPEQANTLSRAVGKALVQAIEAVIDATPRVILLSARGKYFSGGGNIDEMVAAGDRFDDLVDEIL